MIPVYKPYLPPESTQYAKEALDSGDLSIGKYSQLVIDKLKEILNVKYVLLTNSGTSAVHLCSKVLKFKYPNIKKIFIPDNVFIAAINPFLYDKEFKLETIKADLNTWNIDLNDLDEKLNKEVEQVALLIVHNIGNIINVPALKRKYSNVIFIEDNCEGFLGEYEGKKSGTEALCAAVSFFSNKTLGVGQLGCFYTNDEEAYDYAKLLANQGMSDKRFIHNELAYNYKASNISAAQLYGQLHVLDDILNSKKQLFQHYTENLTKLGYITQIQENDVKSAQWMFGVRLPGLQSYDMAAQYFYDKQIEIRPMFYPINIHKYLNNNNNIKINDTSVAQQINNESFILPSFPELKERELEYVVGVCKGFVESFTFYSSFQY